MPPFRIPHRQTVDPLREERGSALLEFAIALPLLVVFVVGIYDFSGASNQKQKIEQAAEEGAVLAAAQPRSDVQQTAANQVSMQPVVVAIFNSLAASGVLPNANTGGGCLMPPPTPTSAGPLAWAYTISGCSAYSSDRLVITINRGWVCPAPCSAGPPMALGTSATVTYPYHWQFNSVIQLLIPGASYAAITKLTETATVHNQL
jgi:hypothetical protein